MQTTFTNEQLADPDTRASEQILRTCVHCGFCTATCPTYVLLGDELDSPRGRIYLIKQMLESGKPADGRHGQAYRPLPVLPVLHDHLPVRRALHAPGRSRPGLHRGALSPAPARPAAALGAATHHSLPAPVPPGAGSVPAIARPFAGLMPARLRAMLALAPSVDAGPVASATGRRCSPAEGAAPRPGRAADRLRAAGHRTTDQRGHRPPADPARRRGGDAGGHGLLRRPTHHMGNEPRRRCAFAKANIDAWDAELAAAGWTRSSSTHRAAAPRSRTTASCCATTRPTPRRRRGSRR